MCELYGLHSSTFLGFVGERLWRILGERKDRFEQVLPGNCDDVRNRRETLCRVWNASPIRQIFFFKFFFFS